MPKPKTIYKTTALDTDGIVPTQYAVHGGLEPSAVSYCNSALENFSNGFDCRTARSLAAYCKALGAEIVITAESITVRKRK
jgi:hypothetical protein